MSGLNVAKYGLLVAAIAAVILSFWLGGSDVLSFTGVAFSLLSLIANIVEQSGDDRKWLTRPYLGLLVMFFVIGLVRVGEAMSDDPAPTTASPFPPRTMSPDVTPLTVRPTTPPTTTVDLRTALRRSLLALSDFPTGWQQLRKEEFPGAPRIDDDEFCRATPKGDYEFDEAAVFQGNLFERQRLFHAAAVFRPGQASQFLSAIEASSGCGHWMSPVDGSRAEIRKVERARLGERGLHVLVISDPPNPSVDFLYFYLGDVGVQVAYTFFGTPDQKLTMLYAEKAEQTLAALCMASHFGDRCR